MKLRCLVPNFYIHCFWEKFIYSYKGSYLESLFSCIAWKNSRLNCRNGKKGRELPPSVGWWQRFSNFRNAPVRRCCHCHFPRGLGETYGRKNINWRNINKRAIFWIFHFLYTSFNIASSAPLRFCCVKGCWDLTCGTVATLALTARRSNYSARSHPLLWRDIQ
jgi:hypothetical protein